MLFYINLKQTALFLFCGLLPFNLCAQQRNLHAAKDIASIFFSNRDNSLSSKGYSNIQNELSVICSTEAYHIFRKSSSSNGFVIISGDERMPCILAFSDESPFDIDNMPPSFENWLKENENWYYNINNYESLNVSNTTLAHADEVSPLLRDIVWGQGNPFNKTCPVYHGETCLTGCVATAMAQVMKYYEYPASGKGKVDYYTQTNHIHVTRDLSKDIFDWGNMRHSYTSSFSTTEVNAVATLMASCGASVRMDYGTDSQGGSGAYQSDLLPAFVENFGYDKNSAVLISGYFSTNDWHELLLKELNEGHPVNYGGHSITDGGHSFVLDGYKMIPENIYPNYHVNWGWNGSFDGYYQIQNLQPKESGQSYFINGFNQNQQMLIGIKPDDGIDDGFTCIGTKQLNVTSSTLSAGKTFGVSTSSIQNFAYKDISGTFAIALIAGNGEETLLSVNKSYSLYSLLQINNFKIETTLPQDIKPGLYQVQLRIKPTGKDEYKRVYSYSYPKIEILESKQPQQTGTSLVGCSDIDVSNNPSDPSEIQIRLYELINLEEEPFTGELFPILTDTQANELLVVGDDAIIDEIGNMEVMSYPFLLKCKIPSTLADGSYRIYLGIRRLFGNEHSYVVSYDITFPVYEYRNLYLNLEKRNGVVTIGNHTYLPYKNYITGDVNDDGIVDITDVNIVTDFYLGNTNTISMKAADVNEDGVITNSDINEILNIHLKNKTTK